MNDWTMAGTWFVTAWTETDAQIALSDDGSRVIKDVDPWESIVGYDWEPGDYMIAERFVDWVGLELPDWHRERIVRTYTECEAEHPDVDLIVNDTGYRWIEERT